jgi:hypothetical protein
LSPCPLPPFLILPHAFLRKKKQGEVENSTTHEDCMAVE